jgi:spore coat protein CotH
MSTLEAEADAEVPARLTHGTDTFRVGLRIKGSTTRRGFDGKPSLKIDAHAWAEHQRFYGLRRLTLNNMVQDASMLREHVAYHLYRELGVPAPRHGYARLTVNGTPYGLYGLVESMDGQFIDGWWPEDDEGNLYEGGYGADLRAGRADSFTVQVTGDPPPFADLEALIRAVEESDDAGWLPLLQRSFDLDRLLDALAIDLVSGGWDGYARAANNFLLYHAPRAARWTLLPWGQDQAFDDRYVPFDAGWEGRLLVRCGRSPACAEALHARVPGVLEVWSGLPAYARATAASIRADCEADPRAEHSCWPDDLLEFLEERPSVLQRTNEVY